MIAKIAQVAVGLPVEGPFDYKLPERLHRRIALGQRVKIFFNHRLRLGYVVGFRPKSIFKKLNPILEILDDDCASLNEYALSLTKYVSQYYGCSWGEAINASLPVFLKRIKNFSIPQSVKTVCQNEDFVLPQRTILVQDLIPHKKWPFLGDEIQKVFNAGRSVLFLVPEIFLIEDIRKYLGPFLKDIPTVILDKKLPGKSELEEWLAIKRGEKKLILGSRSAVFAPDPSLGLIVMYAEEHPAYKQEQTPHYHAREIAFMRQAREGCSIILTSSAPCPETWLKAKKEKWEKIIFKDSYSSVHFIDMSNYNPRKMNLLSFPLQSAIQKNLEEKGKSILLLNRRGFNTLTRCSQCGFTLKCERCTANLFYLYSQKIMICPRCNFKTALPKLCPQCESNYLRSQGTGIEKLESEVARFFPQANVGRLDKEKRDLLQPVSMDILVSTQAVLRYFENMSVPLMAVLDFDRELNHADFRSAHRAFHLLVQLRLMAKEKFFVQTRMMDNYCLEAIKNFSFEDFYKKELKFRRELGFPPYNHLIALGLRGLKENDVIDQSKMLLESLTQHKLKGIEISDLHPDVILQLRGQYRYVILLKGKAVVKMVAWAKDILKGVKRKSGIIVTINVDP